MILETTERIREIEEELLLQYISETNEQGSISSPAEKIALALTRITSLYNQAIRNERGPSWWVCGTHLDNQRKNISRHIGSRYTKAQLDGFVDFCCCKTGERTGSLLSKGEATQLIEELLALRPEPCVHPPLSYWHSLLDK